jgi:serine/threonine protein phosphatase PrpC
VIRLAEFGDYNLGTRSGGVGTLAGPASGGKGVVDADRCAVPWASVMARPALKFGFLSVTGNFRDNNEDNCCCDSKSRYFLVADGMGGQSAGERASQLAVELISEKLDNIDFERSAAPQISKAIDDAVSYANSEIMALGELDPKFRNMGTTVAFLVSAAGRLFCGGVGDSRVYLLRNGSFDQLTKDHSLTQALVDAGTISAADAANHRYKNVLYRYLGSKEGGTGTDPKSLEPQPGDRFVLCSDGVTDGIDPETIHDLLKRSDEPQKAAETIVEAALEGGSRDNVTCVVVFVENPKE